MDSSTTTTGLFLAPITRALVASLALVCTLERAVADGCVVLSDPSTFTYDLIPSPDGRYVATVAFPPPGTASFPGFGYVGTFPSYSPKGGLTAPLEWNLYEIDPAGNGTLVIGSGVNDQLNFKFARSGALQGRLFATENALPGSSPNALYELLPSGPSLFSGLSGSALQGPNGLAFPGGGSLGDLLYVATFCSQGCGSGFDRAISAYDETGAFQGHLAQSASGPYHLAVDQSGGFGEYLYFTSLLDSKIRRVDASGAIEEFATLPQTPNYSGELAFGLGGDFGFDLYVAGAGGTVWRVDSAGQVQLFASGLLTTSALAFEPASGELFLGDAANGIVRIRPGTTTGYCTAGSSASGCSALLTTSGLASATAPDGFALCASSVEGQKDGFFYFGTNGRQAHPWGNGTSYQCVVPPVVRAGLLTGSGSTGLCDGSFSQDLNALWCPSCPIPQKNPGAGALVQAQLWYRDPLNTSNQVGSLSGAVEFTVSP